MNTLFVKYTHKWGTNKQSDTIVNVAQKGQHKAHCLCLAGCEKFQPEGNNCKTAAELYAWCVRHNTVAPVWECPEFVPPEGTTVVDQTESAA